jgi:hypothetical protein
MDGKQMKILPQAMNMHDASAVGGSRLKPCVTLTGLFCKPARLTHVFDVK